MHCPTNASKLILCKFCPKKLMTDSAMAMHVKSHLNKTRYFQCVLCPERFTLSIDLTEHVVKHLNDGSYSCSKCSRVSNYFNIHLHVNIIINFIYEIFQKYTKYADIRKHIRAIHPDVSFPCPTCGRCFKSPNKLRLHQLSHSDVRAFQCLDCGVKFKRKDKLQKHMVSQHTKRKEAFSEQPTVSFHAPQMPKVSKKVVKKYSSQKSIANLEKKPTKGKLQVKEVVNTNNVDANPAIGGSKMDPNTVFQNNCNNNVITETALPSMDVSHNQTNHQEQYLHQHLPDQPFQDHIEPPPSYFPNDPNHSNSQPIDYQRFIYKCHICRLGFKRRGMLVNHLVKLHPTIPVESVPELNLPILKAQRYYYCAYCDKIYKSNSKRKWHILRNHPGKELPVSCKVSGSTEPSEPGMPNASFSEPVGSVTALPQHCNWCHKQYASKGRLLNHLRMAHPDRRPDDLPNHKPIVSAPNDYLYQPTYHHSDEPFNQYHTNLDPNAAMLPSDQQFSDYLPNDHPQSFYQI